MPPRIRLMHGAGTPRSGCNATMKPVVPAPGHGRIRAWVLALASISAFAPVAHADPFAYIQNAVGTGPDGIAVAVIDIDTNTVVATLPLERIGSTAVSPDGEHVYITDDNGILVLNARTHNVIGEIPAPAFPGVLTVAPNGTRLYVATRHADDDIHKLKVIDRLTHAVLASIDISGDANGIAVTPDGGTVYVTGYFSKDVSIVDVVNNVRVKILKCPPSVVGTFEFDMYAYEVAISPDGSRAYVTCIPDGIPDAPGVLMVIDTSTRSMVGAIDVGLAPAGVATSPDGSRVYVANSTSNSVWVLDSTTFATAATIPVTRPTSIDVTSDGSRVVVTHGTQSRVSVIRASDNAVIASPTLVGRPFAFGRFISPFAAKTLEVLDVNRIGVTTTLPVAGVTVTLTDGTTNVASAVTDAKGRATFDAGTDMTRFYDVRLEREGLRRVYQSVKPSLHDVTLTLPRLLRGNLGARLNALDATSPLVLGYNTVAARATLDEWNTLQPELASLHIARDQALGRLLTASDALGFLYNDTQPLAAETAKLTVDLITSVLSLRSVCAELSRQARLQLAGQVAQAVTTNVAATLAQEILLKTLELAISILQESISGAIASVLPQFSQEVYGQAIDVTSKAVLTGLQSGDWDNLDGRSGFLAGLVEVVAAEVGGRVIGSAYVLQTQQDLILSVSRTRARSGSGTVNAGFIASQNHAVAVSLRNGEVLSFSQALGDTAKKWGIAADLGLLVARTGVPLSQVIGVAGLMVKSMSVGLVIGAGVNDYVALEKTAFDDVPVATGRAYNPTLPAPSTAGNETAGSKQLMGAHSQLTAWRATLLSLKARVAAVDQPGAFMDIRALMDLEDALEATVQQQRVRFTAAAATTRTASIAAAHRAMVAATGQYAAERILLYGSVIGYVIPQFAEEDASDASLLEQIDRALQAADTFESALAGASPAIDGVAIPGMLLITSHGVAAASFGMVAPGPFEFSARVVNGGDSALHGVSVELAVGGVDGAPDAVSLTSPATLAIGTLAAGETRTVTWTAATLIDHGVATYRIDAAVTDGSPATATGSIEIVAGEPIVDGPRVFANGFEP
jgi:YVTN family beta-propeller protein